LGQIKIGGIFLKNNVVFSVVVTNFNQEKYILECLDSIKNQTYPSIELVICDDKSSDNSIEKIEKWIELNKSRFENVVFIKNEVNKGIGGNHNVGLVNSTGEYIAFIHGDDLLYDENSLQNLLEFIEKKKILFCAARMQPFIDMKNGVYKKLELFPDDRSYRYFDLGPEKQFRLLSRADFVPGVMAFKTDFLREIGGFDEKYRIVEDWTIWLEIARMGYQINCYPDPFILYRRHPESITMSSLKNGNPGFYKYKLKTINEYILPHKDLLGFRDKWIVLVNKLYLERLIKFGCDEAAHKKARIVKLIDPIFIIKSRWQVIKSKIEKKKAI
jgi:alpha-1,3-rhamnosyltransferase